MISAFPVNTLGTMSQFRILGLDVSTKLGLGVAICDPVQRMTTLKGWEYQYRDRGFDLIRAMTEDIRIALREWRPHAVFIEGYSYGSRSQIVTMVQIGTGVRWDLYRMDVPAYEVAPSTLKLVIAGQGNADKTRVTLALYRDFGFEASTDNVADGVGLAITGGYYLGAITAPKLAEKRRASLQKITQSF